MPVVSLLPLNESGDGASLYSASVTIENGDTDSEVVHAEGFALVGVRLPAALTGANISFLGGESHVSMKPLHDGSGLIAYGVTADTELRLEPAVLYGLNYLQVKSDATELADRTLILYFKAI